LSNVHEITLPVKVVVGSNVLDYVWSVVEKTELSRIDNIGIVTGWNTYEIYGRRVEELFKSRGKNVFVWRVSDAQVSTAERIVEEAQSRDVKLLVGVGGGKAIDVAKYVAYRVKGFMISVPTAASHDGIASPFASLKGLDKPTSMYTVTPYAIIADIDVISKAPPRLIKAGIGDLLAKLSAVKDWRLAHRLKNEYYGEYAAELALLSAKHVIQYHEIIASGVPEGVRILVEALISSGVAMCIAGSSRPASGSEHLFAHAIELISPGKILHGEAVAFGTMLMLYLHGDPLWKKVRKVMRNIGLPTTVRELGLPLEIVIEALTTAHKIRPERYTILGENGLTREAAYNLLRETGALD